MAADVGTIQTLTGAIIALLPVAVGGLIGVLGTVLGPPITHLLGRSAKRSDRRVERFEEMMAKLYEYDRWLQDVRHSRLYGAPETQRASPLPRVQTIAAMHFPQLEVVLLQLSVIGLEYEVWLLEAKRKLLTGPETYDQGFREIVEQYKRKFSEAEQAMHTIARTRLKA